MEHRSKRRQNDTTNKDNDLNAMGVKTSGAGKDDQAVRSGQREVPRLDFLSLPDGIRNRIYEYVLGGTDWYINEGRTFWDFTSPLAPLRSRPNFKAINGRRNALALLQTCRQIFHETLPVRYYQLSKLPTGIQYIRSIVMDKTMTRNFYRRDITGLMRRLPNVQKIHILDDYLQHIINRRFTTMMIAEAVLKCHPHAAVTMDFEISLPEWERSLSGSQEAHWRGWIGQP
ncbi:hypothetical protein DM02DRAFT_621759 [Periconia macrospinosa]|uniref:Uncharacterized protein n=1 Tax=Periconia macrospinosa TaxID=97972 RepID=A0A2V1EDW6_9PLEO|nr:hypothetical protein DM02DRAFT_621759 [Periconia macrospinosa]